MQIREMLVSLSPQKLFDTAIRGGGMAQQGYRCNLFTKKSTGDNCAVGHCMKPEALEYLLRGGKNRDTLQELTRRDGSVLVELLEFLEDLQRANDGSATREQFYVNMGRVASTYALTLITYHAVLNEEWRKSPIWQR
jgi:hypothetical protein